MNCDKGELGGWWSLGEEKAEVTELVFQGSLLFWCALHIIKLHLIKK